MKKQRLYIFATLFSFFSIGIETRNIDKIYKYLEKYERPFTVLEIGYNPGSVFSFDAAERYPNSFFLYLLGEMYIKICLIKNL